MEMTEEDKKDMEEILAKMKQEIFPPRTRFAALFLGLAGWVMYEHWHLVPAVIVWTVAGLMFIASFNMKKSQEK